MKTDKTYWLMTLLLVALVLPEPPSGLSYAQGGGRTFRETGKVVKGKFLQYWETHGGLSQQGFPISEEMQEVSETNGKTYTVQYFERAVFEMHSENSSPNDVLLSLLGVFLYKQRYPAGALGQHPSNDPNWRLFTETGKRIGGAFLDYWLKNGGLPQQGLPISDEFTEVSDLDGKPYKVQYFERAVFEMHPENEKPFEVLLSQLGTFRYRSKYLQHTPAIPTEAVPPTSTPWPTPTPLANCPDVPPGQFNSITPNCAQRGVAFSSRSWGFQPRERVSYCLIAPGQTDCINSGLRDAGPDGALTGDWRIPSEYPIGLYTAIEEGRQSGHKAVGYFKLLPPP